MRIRPHKDDSSENNIFWVTMTDLMTALVLVFIVLFFYTYMTSYYEKIQGKMEQSRASEALEQALKEQNIEANIDTSGVVKISDLELFDVNSYELSEKGKQYLSKFAPAYLNSIFSNEYIICLYSPSLPKESTVKLFLVFITTLYSSLLFNTISPSPNFKYNIKLSVIKTDKSVVEYFIYSILNTLG